MPTSGVLQTSPLSFEQNNPFLTGLQQGQSIGTNFLNQQMLRQQIQGAQNANVLSGAQAQYAQPSALAELLQKQAQPGLTQAQAAQANAIAQLHGTQAQLAGAQLPYAQRAALADLQQKQALAQGSDIANQLAAGKVQPGIAQAQAQAYPNSVYSNAIQRSRITGENPADILRSWGALPAVTPPPPPATFSGSTAATNGGQPLTIAPQQMGQLQQGLNAVNTSGLISPALTPKLSSGNIEQNVGLLGTGYSPGQTAQMTEQGKQNVIQYQKAMDNANKQASDGTQLSRDLDSFKKAYQDSTYKGPLLGTAPTKGILTALMPGDLTPEQTLDSLSAKMMAGIAREAVGGRVTNYDAQNWISQLKPGRTMEAGALNNMANILQSSADRSSEEPAFIDTAVKNGIDPKTAQALYNKYDKERPPYDPKTMTPIPDNKNSWPNYISQNAIDALHSGQPFMPNLPKGNQINIQDSKGKTHTILSENLATARQRDPGLKVVQ